jgi:hypothetical protein
MMCCHVSQYLIIIIIIIIIEIIWDVQFTCLHDLDYDTWPNVNVPHGITINLIQNNNIKFVGT